MLHPGVLQVSSGEPVAQLAGGAQELLAAMALARTCWSAGLLSGDIEN